MRLRDSDTLPAGFSVFRLCPEVNYPVGGRSQGKLCVYGIWGQISQSYPVTIPKQLGGGDQALHHLWALNSISAVILRSCFLLERAGSPTTTPITAWAPHCLNFSVGPHQTLLLSTTTSHGHLLLKHCNRMSTEPLIHNCSMFSSSQSISASNKKPTTQNGILL
jgi:hypothetical protein